MQRAMNLAVSESTHRSSGTKHELDLYGFGSLGKENRQKDVNAHVITINK